jgi:hypothetical protein
MTDDQIKAMNAEIQAFVAPALPTQPHGLTMDDREGWAAWQEKFRTAWRAAMAQTDHIRRKHGLVPCGDASGWRYAG